MSWLVVALFGASTAFSPPPLRSFSPRVRPCAASSSRAKAEATLAVALAGKSYKTSAALLLESLNRTLGDVEKEVGRSPIVELLHSPIWDKMDCFQWCLDQGCEPVVDDMHLLTGQRPEFLKLMLDYGARPDMVDAEQRTPLEKLVFASVQHGATRKDVEAARHLLDAGADPNKVAAVVQGSKVAGVQGDTLLALAIRGRDIPMASVLIEYGASPIVINKNTGESAIELLRDFGESSQDMILISTLIEIMYPLNTTNQ